MLLLPFGRPYVRRQVTPAGFSASILFLLRDQHTCDNYNNTPMLTLDALILSLPTRNSTIRMRVWRALKESGCAVLRDGVYVLPSGSARAAVLTQMESEVRSVGGFAMTAELRARKDEDVAPLRAQFDRSGDYGALIETIRETERSMQRVGPRKAHTSVQRVQRSFDRLLQIDFFPGEARRQAAEALAALKQRLQEAYSLAEPRPARRRVRPIDSAKYQRRIWATRRDLWVDRLASAWLIKRFIDPNAKFVWIDRPRDRPPRAVGFDFDGAEFTHANHRVTFEVLLASFGLDHDPALTAIGAAVHFLDIGGVPVADAKGLETVLRGIKEKAQNDDALLAQAMRILDHFYSAYARIGKR
jgi:hypothetical protein